MPKRTAEEHYEKALDEGDLPLMLEYSDEHNGVCTANLGALKPGEEVKLKFCFAKILRYELGRVRILIPTIVGERYSGNGRQGKLLPHQNVTSNIFADYGGSARFTIEGPLADATVTCANHVASFQKEAGKLLVRIDKATPNRDITLLCENVAPFATAQYAKNAEGLVASLITTVYEPNVAASTKPLRLKVLVDCSGSMFGIPIEQAKAALQDLLSELGQEDEMTFSRFGSDVVHDVADFVPVTKTALRRTLLPAVRRTDANLGGTEMLHALSEVMQLGKGRQADILLITDGGIWQSEELIELAKSQKQRIFVLVVSSHPAEVALHEIAEATGGIAAACMPCENMTDAVVSLVELMRSAGAERVRLGRNGRYKTSSVFKGTLLEVLAFGDDPEEARQWVPQAVLDASVPIPPFKELAFEDAIVLERLYGLAAMRQETDWKKRQEIAERFGILSSGVNFLLVKERAESEKYFGETTAEVVPEMIEDQKAFMLQRDLHDRSIDEAEFTRKTRFCPARRLRSSRPMMFMRSGEGYSPEYFCGDDEDSHLGDYIEDTGLPHPPVLTKLECEKHIDSVRLALHSVAPDEASEKIIELIAVQLRKDPKLINEVAYLFNRQSEESESVNIDAQAADSLGIVVLVINAALKRNMSVKALTEDEEKQIYTLYKMSEDPLLRGRIETVAQQMDPEDYIPVD